MTSAYYIHPRNVESAHKQICFQSILPFSPLIPRLKYIMVLLMMRGWLCSSGRRGEENEGGIAEAALRDHYSTERDLKVCACLSTDVVSFPFNPDAKGLKHIPTSKLSNNTNTFKLNFSSGVPSCSDCILWGSVTCLSAAGTAEEDQTVCVLVLDEHLMWSKHESL